MAPEVLRDLCERLRRSSYVSFAGERQTATFSGVTYDLEREDILRAVDAGIFQHDGWMTAQLNGRLDSTPEESATYQSARGPKKTFTKRPPP
jgi:hypothetical protein